MAAVTIYKSTILPVIEYSDFVYDHNIKYLNKKLQGVQNYGLQIAYYTEKKTETLHRDAKLYRLCHLLRYAYRFRQKQKTVKGGGGGAVDKREVKCYPYKHGQKMLNEGWSKGFYSFCFPGNIFTKNIYT